MTIRGILFDCFGVLVDERAEYEALDVAMGAARKRFALESKVAELSGDFTLALMELVRGEPETEEPAEFVPFERAAKDVFAAVLEVRGIAASGTDVAWFWDSFRAAHRAAARLAPGARRLLPKLAAQGVYVGVVTDADRGLVLDALDASGGSAWVTDVTTAADVGYAKPHPAAFIAATKKSGLPLTEIAAVGASYERDLLAARAAGIASLVLLDRHRSRRGLDVPVAATLAKIPGILRLGSHRGRACAR